MQNAFVDLEALDVADRARLTIRLSVAITAVVLFELAATVVDLTGRAGGGELTVGLWGE